ncbi:MAG: 50S ribosomal protein L9 [Coxiellaceae bacterium]|nr:50S ribosomal protein L9 [Coxiellaceae bacterium]
MRVILQEKIAHLGDVGDEVTVKRGFGRNYLIPKDMAVIATPENQALFEKRRAELEKASAAKLTAAQARGKALEGLTVKLEAQAGEEGKLFGSIGPRDVAEAITAAGQAIEKSEVDMPEGPIRNIGEYDVTIHLHSEVFVTVKVEVVAAATE